MNEKFTIVHNGMLYMIRTPRTFLLALASLIEKVLLIREKFKFNFLLLKIVNNGYWKADN